ncbi:MAG: class I SAM-dependent methyltransferase [Alphaproteobacteria bacterium]|jgi:SAM-dependent methyltransferase|nr:class I SAM-dependent methyltransferase [Alphaproteobacteria bacterium]MBT4710697.1 class I SAM-dependent methyltransferase [Alphaproteobacteria bacterium]
MIPCQVCAATERHEFATRDHPHFGPMTLWQCAVCGFVYLDPMPSADALAAQYDSDTSDGYFAKADRKLARSKRRLRRLNKFATSGRFLDVGCNGGFMVEAARAAGFETIGIDPDPASIDWAQNKFPGNTFQRGTLEEFAGTSPEPFNAIYCSEVIEHVPDCNAFLDAITGMMTSGGVLYLTTPDLDHWRRPENLDAWDAFKPPEHCLYFSAANLIQLLEGHGLTLVHRAIAFKPGIKVIARK